MSLFTEQQATAADWQSFRESHPLVQVLDAFIIDVNGQPVGKRLRVEDAAALFVDGLNFSACAPLLDCRGLGHEPAGLGGADGDPDATAWPVAGTLVVVPWSRVPAAQVLLSMAGAEQSEPWWDPRELLREVVNRLASDGLHPVVACELEFYLLRPAGADDGTSPEWTPAAGLGRAANLSLDNLEGTSEVLEGIHAAACRQGIPTSTTVSECGQGQFEVNLRHRADPVRAADDAVLLRRIVRGVARQHGLRATFMAKPFAREPGSGLHVHASIADATSANRFGSAEGERWLRGAIGGLQQSLAELLALLAPNFNSHRRLAALPELGTADWGFNNRSVPLRIPLGAPSSRRIECRVAGADASPHLVMAAVLAAMHRGIVSGAEPTAPQEGRKTSSCFREPVGVAAALAQLADAKWLAEYFPPRFIAAFVELKRGELADLFAEVQRCEREFYL